MCIRRSACAKPDSNGNRRAAREAQDCDDQYDAKTDCAAVVVSVLLLLIAVVSAIGAFLRGGTVRPVIHVAVAYHTFVVVVRIIEIALTHDDRRGAVVIAENVPAIEDFFLKHTTPKC